MLPVSDVILYVFYDFETTQNTEYSARATLHVPNLVCAQQFVPRARTWKTSSEPAYNVARGSTRSGKILPGTCYLICANNAPGLKDCRDSSQRQSIRPSFHPEPRNTVEM